MANDIQKLYDLPEISFIDGITYDQILNEMVNDYEIRYQEITGRKAILRPGDKEHIHLRIVASQYFQMYEILDWAAKMNLLKYSKGSFLEHLGALKGTFREKPKASIVTARFALSGIRKDVVYIPQGTRITAGDGIYFKTDEYAEVKAGDSYVDVECTCEVAGKVGDNYAVGQLEIIVDPIPYVASVKNITVSEGGADEETDTRFREKVYLAPSSYSVAGPGGAYEYWVKEYNSAGIEDVKIHDPDDCTVDIRILLSGGRLPTEAYCTKIRDYLKDNPIIPLTDRVYVSAPDVVEYDLTATYYIARSDIWNMEAIQRSIAQAKDTYISWQKTKIGRDINPDALTEFIRAAGGKRIVIESPSFTVIPETSVAIDRVVTFLYGGIEDD